MYKKLRDRTSNDLLCVRGMFFFFLCVFAMSEVHLATLNVNGARDIRKRAMLNEVIKQNKN